MGWQLAPALSTLLAEVNAAYPDRDKRTDGTISGYPGSISSHNVNSAGFVCALDITTGPYPGGISTAQGQALAEQVRLAIKIQPRGIPAYPIHYMAPPYVPTPGPYIATAGTDWEWEPYGFPGSDPHTSHLHISADWDIYAGQSPSGQADYMTQLSWGITKLSGQASGITPITEDIFMALTDEQQQRILAAADRINGTIPDRRHASGAVVKMAMEDGTFSKADGAYQNTLIQRDLVPAVGRIETALGTKPDKIDLAAAILAGGSGDAEVIAAAVIDAVGAGLAGEVVDALAVRLGGQQ